MTIEQEVFQLWQKHQAPSVNQATEGSVPPFSPLISQGLLSFTLPDSLTPFNRINPSVFALQLYYLMHLHSHMRLFAEQFYSQDPLLQTPFPPEWMDLRERALLWSKNVFMEKINGLILQKTNAFMRGVMDYHTHPYTRNPMTDAPFIWQEGQATLRDVNKEEPLIDGQITVLMIPSLINRAYILDLTPEHSLAQFLKKQGYRVIILDWGTPVEEKSFDFQTYLTKRLIPAAQFIKDNYHGPLVALGYCMGGIFSLALSQHIELAGLILLATPWDFHGEHTQKQATQILHTLMPILEQEGALPADILTSLFYTLNPEMILEKFERFMGWTDSDKKQLFVALEDWAGDTVPLAKGVTLDLVDAWLTNNALLKGTWRVDGQELTPSSITLPTLLLEGENDRICPPAMTAPLHAALPQCTHARVPVGHTGLIVGQTAQQKVWPHIDGWLQSLPNDCYSTYKKKQNTR